MFSLQESINFRESEIQLCVPYQLSISLVKDQSMKFEMPVSYDCMYISYTDIDMLLCGLCRRLYFYLKIFINTITFENQNEQRI
jgi:hypothetical protein